MKLRTIGLALLVHLASCSGAQAQYLRTDGEQHPRDYRQRTPLQAVSPQLFDQVPWETVGPGQRRKVLFNDRLTMVLLEIVDAPSQAALTTHYHAHDQITLILEGKALVRVGQEERQVEAGAAYVAPSNIHHGLKPLTPRFVLVECFTPTREDFRGSATPPPIKPLSPNKVRSLVYDWFSLFDRQASSQEHLLLLDPQGFNLKFPGSTMGDAQQFHSWHSEIVAKYPKVSHEVRSLQVTPSNGGCRVELEVGWTVENQRPLWFRQIWKIRDWDGFPVISEISVEPL